MRTTRFLTHNAEERSQLTNNRATCSVTKVLEKSLIKEETVDDASGERIGLDDSDGKSLVEQGVATQKSKGVPKVERVKTACCQIAEKPKLRRHF